MVEEMTQEILSKEEDVEHMAKRIAELEDMNQCAEELTENQEQYIKELNVDVAERDAKISMLQLSVKEAEK